jgi:formylglycine-generating enzyme required for sulfatase activity
MTLRALGRMRPGLVSLLCLVVSCRDSTAPQSAQAACAIVPTKSGIDMVRIPAGMFQMGGRDGAEDSLPVHKVSVEAFLMDRCEMTQERFLALAAGNPLIGGDPSHFKGPTRPVEMIRWDIAALLCNERSRLEGLEPCYDAEGNCNFAVNGYRLPTEAEWEYACRAGSTARYAFGDDARALDAHAWYGGNAGKETHPVARRKPNAWGLYDMYGNVAEWCNDRYAKDYYAKSPADDPHGPAEGKEFVLRGGAWSSSAESCRSAFRAAEEPGVADACFARDAVGFRCVRRAPAAPAGTP